MSTKAKQKKPIKPLDFRGYNLSGICVADMDTCREAAAAVSGDWSASEAVRHALRAMADQERERARRKKQ